MSEKLLELSSVVDVISRTVADLEKQRQNNETRSAVLNALVLSIVTALPADRRAEVARNFKSASEGLLQASTSTSRQALKKQLTDLQTLLS